MWAVLSGIGLLVLGALSFYVRLWLPHRREWNWDEHKYPAGSDARIGDI